MIRAILVVALVSAAGSAAAEESSGMFAAEGTVGVGAVMHGGTFAAFDLVEHLHIGYRLPIGLQGGLSFHHGGALGGDQDHSAELFLIGAELRYHPFADHCVDPWLGFGIGFGGLHEEGSGPWRREQWNGSSLLLNLGVLFRVTRDLALGGWVGTTLGLWTQDCVLNDPYQLEHCIVHRDARVVSIGVSVAPRFTGR